MKWWKWPKREMSEKVKAAMSEGQMVNDHCAKFPIGAIVLYLGVEATIVDNWRCGNYYPYWHRAVILEWITASGVHNRVDVKAGMWPSITRLEDL